MDLRNLDAAGSVPSADTPSASRWHQVATIPTEGIPIAEAPASKWNLTAEVPTDTPVVAPSDTIAETVAAVDVDTPTDTSEAEQITFKEYPMRVSVSLAREFGLDANGGGSVLRTALLHELDDPETTIAVFQVPEHSDDIKIASVSTGHIVVYKEEFNPTGKPVGLFIHSIIEPREAMPTDLATEPSTEGEPAPAMDVEVPSDTITEPVAPVDVDTPSDTVVEESSESSLSVPTTSKWHRVAGMPGETHADTPIEAPTDTITEPVAALMDVDTPSDTPEEAEVEADVKKYQVILHDNTLDELMNTDVAEAHAINDALLNELYDPEHAEEAAAFGSGAMLANISTGHMVIYRELNAKEKAEYSDTIERDKADKPTEKVVLVTAIIKPEQNAANMDSEAPNRWHRASS